MMNTPLHCIHHDESSVMEWVMPGKGMGYAWVNEDGHLHNTEMVSVY